MRKLFGKMLGKAALKLLGKTSNPFPADGQWRALVGQIPYAGTSNGAWRNLTDSDLLDFSKAGVCYACLRALSVAIQEAYLEIGRWVEDGFEPITHPTLDAILRPNKWFSFEQLIETIVFNLGATGEAYLWEIKNNAGQVVELWPIPSSWVTPEINGNLDNPYDYFEIAQGGGKSSLRVSPDDITFLRLPNPSNPFRGYGPLQAINHDVQNDSERENFINGLIVNTQAPGAIIQVGQGASGLSDGEMQELKAAITESTGGKNRGSNLILGREGLEYVQPSPLSDFDFNGMSGLSESRICSAFGVPPIWIGVRVGLENSPWSNIAEAGKIFYQGTVLPWLKTLAAGLTRGLLHNEGEPLDIEFRFNTDDIGYLQSDRLKIAQEVQIAVAAGLMQVNEGRARMGLPRDDALGDVYLYPVNVLPVPANETLPERDNRNITDEI